MARMTDLRQKEIINVHCGSRYGYVGDVELDTATGRITALVVPGPGRLMGLLGGGEEYVIPWADIKKIGEDIIIVDTAG